MAKGQIKRGDDKKKPAKTPKEKKKAKRDKKEKKDHPGIFDTTLRHSAT
jgi:hypothetical protein